MTVSPGTSVVVGILSQPVISSYMSVFRVDIWTDGRHQASAMSYSRWAATVRGRVTRVLVNFWLSPVWQPSFCWRDSAR